MIHRYEDSTIGHIWNDIQKIRVWSLIELQALRCIEKHNNIIPIGTSEELWSVFDIMPEDLDRCNEIEKETRHDVAAFVKMLEGKTNLPSARFIHYGLTSSDVVDTYLSYSIKKSLDYLKPLISKLIDAIRDRMNDHPYDLCFGRTHGMRGQITTVSMFFASHLTEIQRALDDIGLLVLPGKLSGAVGICPNFSIETEIAFVEHFELSYNPISTQVIPRDYYSRVVIALAQFATAMERFAINLRHLHRSEVSDMHESFAEGQRGSSAMPHKKNPITSEQICGLSRLMRSYIGISLENCCLWHERDISHSSNERIIFPDMFHTICHMTKSMTNLIENLHVDAKKMNQEVSECSELKSEQVMLFLIRIGWSRNEAWKKVHELASGNDFGEEVYKNMHELRMHEQDFNKIFGKNNDYILNAIKKVESI